MGEPITLYTVTGEMVTVYGKNHANEMIGAGGLLESPPPALSVEEEVVDKQPAPRRDATKDTI
jgi:hypothetical protein